jgi:hypothetical protein
MSGNEHLLDGLFQEEEQPSSSESGDSDDGIVDTAEMIIRGASSEDRFRNKWISENGLLFYYDSERQKLLLLKNNCYFEYEGNGEFQFTGRVDPVQPTVSDEQNHVSSAASETVEVAELPSIWITSVPRSLLTIRELAESESPSAKRQKTDSFKIPFLSDFFHKYAFDDSFIRHILKLDRLLVSYIILKFNPLKAKPKNAFKNFCDSLNEKFPQPWRWKSFLTIPEEDRADCETKPLRTSLVFGQTTVGTAETGFDFDIISADVPSFSGQFFLLGNDAYVMMNEDGGVTVLVDGIRCVPSEGPVGPLKDGTVVTVRFGKNSSSNELIPDHMFIVELAKTEEELVVRRGGSN